MDKALIFLSSSEAMLTDFREREREGVREGEKHRRASYIRPNQGPNPKPKHLP